MQPYLFSIASIPIPSFALFAGFGVLLAFAVAIILAGKNNLDVIEIISYGLFFTAAAWIGSIVYKLIFTFVKDPGGLFSGRFELGTLIRNSGTSIIGALIGAVLFSVIYLRKISLPFWTTLDITFTGIPLAQAFGRIGCFLGGCCYGRPTDLPWGVTLPGHAHAVHPTQLYEAVLNLGNFFILLTLFGRKSFNGRVFSQYLINYSVIRFFVEYWRGDDYRGFVWWGGSPWTSLSIPQAISLLGLTAGLLLWHSRRKKDR